jgi:hypothetical protein
MLKHAIMYVHTHTECGAPMARSAALLESAKFLVIPRSFYFHTFEGLVTSKDKSKKVKNVFNFSSLTEIDKSKKVKNVFNFSLLTEIDKSKLKN